METVGVLPVDPAWASRPCLKLDLGPGNPRLAGVDHGDPAAFGRWVDSEIERAGCRWAAGGWGERRAVYDFSGHFGRGDTARSLHLGTDLWLPAGTAVRAAFDATVHSLANNAVRGDYGPTVILQHPGAPVACSLYGHLAARTLDHLTVGQSVAAGETIGWLGRPDENLGWPPHLHFQLIDDIGEHRGDFPGVCRPDEGDTWLQRCPDPARWLPMPAMRRSP